VKNFVNSTPPLAIFTTQDRTHRSEDKGQDFPWQFFKTSMQHDTNTVLSDGVSVASDTIGDQCASRSNKKSEKK